MTAKGIKKLAPITPWNVRNPPIQLKAQRVGGSNGNNSKGLSKHVPSVGEQKEILDSNNNVMAMDVNPWAIRLQLLQLLSTYVIVCYVSESSSCRERSPGKKRKKKSWDYCNGNLMCSVHFLHKEKQTESYNPINKEHEIQTKPSPAPLSKVTDESPSYDPLFMSQKEKQTHHDFSLFFFS